MTDTTTPTLIQTRFGFASTAAEVVEGIDLSRQARDRHRRLVRHRDRDRTRAGRRGRRGHARRARHRRRRADRRRHHRYHRQHRRSTSRRSTSPTEPPSPRSSRTGSGPLHMLVNNAGVMALPELQRTPEGWELQFATNHLGHFALALGLHDALAAAGDARIVSRQLHRAPALAGDLRRPELRLPSVRRRGSPTGSPRPPTSYSPSRRRAAGVATASPPTRSIRARSRPPT